MSDATKYLTLDEYQKGALTTAVYPVEHRLTYPILGLAGEVGEIANKYKKVLRDGREFSREDLRAELGDVLWYLAVTAADAGIELGEVAAYNLVKLESRKARGTLQGSGDNR